MAVDPAVLRSRRAVLAAAVAAGAGSVLAALGRPLPASAADPNDVLLGGPNAATGMTSITNGTNGETVLAVGSSNGVAIAGASGVEEPPQSITTSTGVYGISLDGTGVYGASQNGAGVYGASHATAMAAVVGQGNDGTGIHGHAGDVLLPAAPASTGVLGSATGAGTGVRGQTATGSGIVGVSNGEEPSPAAPAATGVFGYAGQDANSRGVTGESVAGRGVNGLATTGRGVHGQATSGLGVRGYATSGVGVSGEATTGYALRTSGRVRLDKSAGNATVAAETSSVLVTPGVDLTGTSTVLATLNGNAGGSTTVKRVSIDAAANTFNDPSDGEYRRPGQDRLAHPRIARSVVDRRISGW
jgi:hypothetical protein